MSSIPSSAMPHAYVHEDEDPDNAVGSRPDWPANAIVIGGAAVVAWLLYRIFR